MMLVYRQLTQSWLRIASQDQLFAGVATMASLLGFDFSRQYGAHRIRRRFCRRNFDHCCKAIWGPRCAPRRNSISEPSRENSRQWSKWTGPGSPGSGAGHRAWDGGHARRRAARSLLLVGRQGCAEAGPTGLSAGLNVGYLLVSHLESLFLFATLMAVGLLVRRTGAVMTPSPSRLGVTELPSLNSLFGGFPHGIWYHHPIL